MPTSWKLLEFNPLSIHVFALQILWLDFVTEYVIDSVFHMFSQGGLGGSEKFKVKFFKFFYQIWLQNTPPPGQSKYKLTKTIDILIILWQHQVARLILLKGQSEKNISILIHHAKFNHIQLNFNLLSYVAPKCCALIGCMPVTCSRSGRAKHPMKYGPPFGNLSPPPLNLCGLDPNTIWYDVQSSNFSNFQTSPTQRCFYRNTL